MHGLEHGIPCPLHSPGLLLGFLLQGANAEMKVKSVWGKQGAGMREKGHGWPRMCQALCPVKLLEMSHPPAREVPLTIVKMRKPVQSPGTCPRLFTRN